MLDIIAFIFFSKKIRQLASEKEIEANPWIWKLVFRWLAIEIGFIAIAMIGFDVSIEDESLILVSLFAIALAFLSALYTLKQLKEIPSNNKIEEIGRKEQNFDHFR